LNFWRLASIELILYRRIARNMGGVRASHRRLLRLRRIFRVSNCPIAGPPACTSNFAHILHVSVYPFGSSETVLAGLGS
jgi:hypothetical protein